MWLFRSLTRLAETAVLYLVDAPVRGVHVTEGLLVTTQRFVILSMVRGRRPTGEVVDETSKVRKAYLSIEFCAKNELMPCQINSVGWRE